MSRHLYPGYDDRHTVLDPSDPYAPIDDDDAYWDVHDTVMPAAEARAERAAWAHQEEPQVCESCGSAFGPLGVDSAARWCGRACEQAARIHTRTAPETDVEREDRLIAASGRTPTGEVVTHVTPPGSTPIADGAVVRVEAGEGIVMAGAQAVYDVWLVE